VRRHWAVFQAAIDAASWALALLIALVIRYDFGPGWHELGRLVRFVPLVIVAQVWIGLLVGLYQRRWRFGSFEEVAAIVVTATLVVALLTGLDLFYLDHLVPVSVPFGAGLFALVGMLGTRYLWRLVSERYRRPVEGEPLVVVGAGEGAAQIVDSMRRDPRSPYVPVALLDDDPRKANLRIRGVRVVGRIDDVVAVADRVSARTVLVAIPTADAELLKTVTRQCAAAGLQVLVLPSVGELLGHRPGTEDIRRPTAADLLGRREVDTDLAAMAGYLAGKRVLVTGAGGSIGSVLCRHISAFSPAELVMVDRDESALHGVQLALEQRALLDTPNLVVADIRDRDRMFEVFGTWKPHVVFHAAALKHLPLLEMHPEEAIKTNVLGTQHVLDAALATDVARFVNISTDKAADPTSVLGRSKRIAERLTACTALNADGVYLSVRFGNVLGTRGSVLETFEAQIAAGGPVTVTDREVTRFFMTVDEAVQLVIQAGAIGRSGEALVLDMGEPVRIADVARQLAAMAGQHIDIEYTGLRPGEKMHEDLWGADERDERPVHPLISHVAVPPIELSAVDDLRRSLGTPGSSATLAAVSAAAPPAVASEPSNPR
jgi:FlaA1/EpsC-like NDP-sugar epimerase